jgi:hypothetical protein
MRNFFSNNLQNSIFISDQVIKEEHIKHILQTVHGTLLSLADNSEPNKTDVAVSFVSRATQSFFLSSRICLLLPSAEDLLITLFTISLYNTYKVTGMYNIRGVNLSKQ